MIATPIRKTALLLKDVIWETTPNELTVALITKRTDPFQSFTITVTPEDRIYRVLRDIADLKDEKAKDWEIEKLNLLPSLFAAVSVKVDPYYVTDKKGNRVLYPEGHPNEGNTVIAVTRTFVTIHGKSLAAQIDDELKSLDFIEWVPSEELLREYGVNDAHVIIKIDRR